MTDELETKRLGLIDIIMELHSYDDVDLELESILKDESEKN